MEQNQHYKLDFFVTHLSTLANNDVLQLVNKIQNYDLEAETELNAVSFPESTCLLVSAKTRSSGIINFQRPRF